VQFRRHDSTEWEALTTKSHGALSGGEKAVCLHLPLFAAAAAYCDSAGIRCRDGDGADAPGAPRLIDTLIYLDANETDIERWFTDRLVPLMEAGANDSKSFYYAFRTMTADERRAFAARVWQNINLPNLRDHIVKDRAAADLVIHKNADHSIKSVTER